MQFYLPLNQDVKIDFHKREIFFSPVYHSIPDFYQKSLTSANEDTTLTRNDLNEALKKKKFERIDFDSESRGEIPPIIILSIIAIAFFFIDIVGAIWLDDKFHKKTNMCKDYTRLMNTKTHNVDRVSISYPCEHGHPPNDNPILNPANLLLQVSIYTITGGFIASLISSLFDCFKQHMYNKSVDRACDYQFEHVKQLSYVVDLEDEVLDRDIGIIFPYLGDELLPRLKFSHLKKAKDIWEELFQKKLDASLFSKQQLGIWRLFQRFLQADNQTQIKMLQEPMHSKIIGSEPLFFQEIIWKISPLKRQCKKTAFLCNILKDKILTKKAAKMFEKEDLIQTVMCVSEQQKLKDVISKHLKKSKKEILEKESFQDSLLLDDSEIAFETFLEDGKLTISKFSDYYAFLSLANEKGDGAIINWLKRHLKKIWEDDKIFSDCFSDDFKMHYQLADDYNLCELKDDFKAHFIASLKNFSFTDPFDVSHELSRIHNILNRLEELFGSEKAKVLDHFKKRIINLLEDNTEVIEELAEASKIEGNQWLSDIIAALFF